MGNSEDEKSSKPEKPSSPAQDQSAAVHVYPDWAAMQAYYGPRVAVPPYFSSAVASGQVPHPYMWGPPQAMMPPYGGPYAAFYAHGGVYAHPGVPLAASPMSMDAPAKSSGTTDRGLTKKLKGFDGLAMSIGNSNPSHSAEGGTDHGISQSGETEGFSDGSNGNSIGVGQIGHKRSCEGTLNTAGNSKIEKQNDHNTADDASKKLMGVTIPAKVMGTVLSPSMTSALDLRDSPSATAKTSPNGVHQPSSVMQTESQLQNERELKRERRKQSNRESARRSRLRKQAEAEELAINVESLSSENVKLKAEINRLTDNSEKLMIENAKLMEKMKKAKLGLTENASLRKVNEKKKALPLSTANLLSRVNNPGSAERGDGEGEMYEKKANTGAKLHQLLDASPRTDAVAAG